MKVLSKIQARINSMQGEEDGATAVEYGLMVSLIALVIITAVALVGTNLDLVFDAIGAAIVVAP